MELTYVTSGAVLQCPFGGAPSKLAVIPSPVLLAKNPMANITDCIAGVNIIPFGTCSSLLNPATAAATALNMGSLTPAPCLPQIIGTWIGGKNNVIVRGAPALLITSKCQCAFGGAISITHDGQIPVPIENPKNDVGGYFLDMFQDALDIVGLIPIVGNAADLANAGIHAIRGNYTMAALSLAAAVPGAGVAVGATKIAVKTVVKEVGKAGAKEATKMAFKEAGKEGAHLTKQMDDKLSDGYKIAKEVASKEVAFNSDLSNAAKEIDNQSWNEKGLPPSIPGAVSVGVIIKAPNHTKVFIEPESSTFLGTVGGIGVKLISLGPIGSITASVKTVDTILDSRDLINESNNISAMVSKGMQPSITIAREFN